jgi:hypothetical protein
MARLYIFIHHDCWSYKQKAELYNAMPAHLQSQLLHLFNGLGRRGQILIAVLGDMDIVLDAHATNLPVPVQDSSINVLAQLWRFQIRVNNETAEVNLGMISTNAEIETVQDLRQAQR